MRSPEGGGRRTDDEEPSSPTVCYGLRARPPRPGTVPLPACLPVAACLPVPVCLPASIRRTITPIPCVPPQLPHRVVPQEGASEAEDMPHAVAAAIQVERDRPEALERAKPIEGKADEVAGEHPQRLREQQRALARRGECQPMPEWDQPVVCTRGRRALRAADGIKQREMEGVEVEKELARGSLYNR